MDAVVAPHPWTDLGMLILFGLAKTSRILQLGRNKCCHFFILKLIYIIYMERLNIVQKKKFGNPFVC